MSDAAAPGVNELPAADAPDARTDPLAGWVFAALVLACLAAFFVTQRLKHTPTAIQNFELTPYFSPTPSGRNKEEHISFKSSRAERVTVEIIDTAGNVTATLLRDRPVPRYKQFSLRWNGHRGIATSVGTTSTASGRTVLLPHNHGRLAPAGEYRVRVKRQHDRAILSPRSFKLVRR